MQKDNIGGDLLVPGDLDDVSDLDVAPLGRNPLESVKLLVELPDGLLHLLVQEREPALPLLDHDGVRLGLGCLLEHHGGIRILHVVEAVAPVVVEALLCDGEEHKEHERKDGGEVPRRAEPRDGLGHADAEEIEVANAAELEDQLLGEEVEDGVPRGADGVVNVLVAAARVEERLLAGRVQRDVAAVSGGPEGFLAQDEFEEDSLVDFVRAVPEGLTESGRLEHGWPVLGRSGSPGIGSSGSSRGGSPRFLLLYHCFCSRNERDIIVQRRGI